MQSDMSFDQTRAQAIDLYVNNVHHLRAGNLAENDHLVNTVNELGSESLLTQALAYQALNVVFFHAIELVKPRGTYVACHDNDGIFEINCAAQAICQAT